MAVVVLAVVVVVVVVLVAAATAAVVVAVDDDRSVKRNNTAVRNRPWTSIQDLFHPNSWQTPVAAVTVYSAPDDGRKGRPQHVELTCSC